jgi:hypothetical protein
MSFEIAAVTAALGPSALSGTAAAPMQAGYGVSLTDMSGFDKAMSAVGARLEARPVGATSEAAQQLMKPFEHINGEASRLALDAGAAQRAGREMSPGDMMMLTVRCQEFMFHCQLTSNIANRTSDGLQQLFRQQS